MGSLTSPNGSASGLRHVSRGFACSSPYALTPGQPPPGKATLLRLSSACLLPARPAPRRNPKALTGNLASRVERWRFKAGTGISTRCPSTTPVGLALGPDLPWADQLDPGTLGQSAQEFPTLVSLLMPAFSLVYRPRLDSSAASPGTRRSPTHPQRRWAYSVNDTTSVVYLSPATLSARNHLTSELLRTLSRVAASKPTSWLSLRLHILSPLAYA